MRNEKQIHFANAITIAGLFTVVFGMSTALSIPASAAIPVATEVRELGTTGDLRIEDGVLRLTLEEAIALALERNLGLMVERYRLSESDYNLELSRGILDPNLNLEANTFDETSPSSTNLDGADVQQTEGQNWNATFGKLFGGGGRGSVTFNNRRLETNSQFATLNPSFRSDFDLDYSYPLLRDRGKEATQRNILIAQTNSNISRESFESQVVQTMVDVEITYWTLLENMAQLEVAEESLALAKQLHEQNQIRVEVGTLAPLELVQSEAGIATRDEQIIRARGFVGDAEDQLRQLINLDVANAWSLSIVPESDPERDPVEIDVEAAIAIALAERPEIRSKRLDQENRNLDTRYYRNQQKPRLDLSVRYGLNGIGGDLTERDFFTGEILFEASGDYGDALSQLADGDFEGWAVALNLDYTLFNKAGKAARALADVAYDRGEAELRDLELGVSTEVRRLVRAVDTAAQARQSAAVSRRLAEKNLEAEGKRYDNGMSTSFQVLEIQEDLSEARSREISAIAVYLRALMQFHRAIGQLTEENGVEIVGPSE